MGPHAACWAMSIPGFDPVAGVFTLPWWLVVLAAAVFVIILTFAVIRMSSAGSLALGLRLVIIALLAGGAWLWVDRSAKNSQAEERRALQMRATELTTRATVPGSPLACLDTAAGEAVANACERLLFASPESVAAATSHVAERLALLSDVVDFAAQTKISGDDVVPGLRQELERDRFGIVAQILMVRDGCTAERCDSFSLFNDTAKIKANLSRRPFDAHVERYAAEWATRSSESPTAAIPVVPPTSGALAPSSSTASGFSPPANGGPSPVPPGFILPSADSIPPVSIMTPEVTSPSAQAAKPDNTESTAEAAQPAPTPPRRRSSRPARTNAPPVQISPPVATGGIQPRAQ